MARICLYCARFPFDAFRVAPLGIGYIASYLVYKGVVCEEDIRIVDSVEEAIRFSPEIVGISSVSQVLKDARGFAMKCKEATGCLTVLGGYHVSCIPQRLPEEFDIGVLGEGEVSFAEFVYKFTRDQLRQQSLREIRGICYRENDRIVQTQPRELIADIDELPWPYRHKCYSSQEPVFTSRGCPYRCAYCASHIFWRDTIRFRSAESVVEEITYLVEAYHPKEILILDDLWMANKKRFREIIEQLVERRIPQKVTFSGFCRSNLVSEEDILLFKRMNYRFVRFGAETGSESLLQRIKGKGISISDHQRVIDLCFKYGLPCAASFMFGVPGETREDLELTKKFLRKNRGKCHISGFYLCNPIPGTTIWDELVKKGKVTEELEFERLQLDFLKPNFTWDNILYFNEENVPLKEFKAIIEDIRREFIPQSKVVKGGQQMLKNMQALRNTESGDIHRYLHSNEKLTDLDTKNWAFDSGERQTAGRIEDIRKDHLNRYQYVADFIKSTSSYTETISVLDVFCGNGYGSFLFTNEIKGVVVDAIDGSAEAIEFAKQNFRSEKITYHNAISPFSWTVPIRPEYDYVVSLESIEHMEDDRRFYEFLLSKLKDNGILFLSFPNKRKIDLSRNTNLFHFRHYDLQDIESIIQRGSRRVRTLQNWGQDVYVLDKDGRTRGLLNESDMVLKRNYEGQFLMVALRKLSRNQAGDERYVNLQKLDVGCGPKKPMPGFVGVDTRPFSWVKYVCDAWKIDKHVRPDSISEIYSRHFFEHLTFAQADLTLKAWERILVPSGTLRIIVPDIEYHIKQFLTPNSLTPSETNPKWTVLEHALAGFWGWQNEGEEKFWDVHKSGYDFRCLEMKLLQHGFSDIRRIDDKPWNLNVICKTKIAEADGRKRNMRKQFES